MSDLVIFGSNSANTFEIPARRDKKDVFFNPKEKQELVYIATLPNRIYKLWVDGFDVAKAYEDGTFDLERGILANEKGTDFLTITDKNNKLKIPSRPFIIRNTPANETWTSLLQKDYPDLVGHLVKITKDKPFTSDFAAKHFACEVHNCSIHIFYNITLQTPQVGILHQVSWENNLRKQLTAFSSEPQETKFPFIINEGLDLKEKNYPITLIQKEKKIAELKKAIDDVRGENWLDTYFRSEAFKVEFGKIFTNEYPEFA